MIGERHRIEHKKVRVSIPVLDHAPIHPPRTQSRDPASRSGVTEGQDRGGGEQEKQKKTRTCEPFVFGPAFAMDRRPGLLCLSLKFSSVHRPRRECRYEYVNVCVCGSR